MTVQTQDINTNFKDFLDISIYLGSTLKLNEVLRRVISICKEVLCAEGSSIILYDEEKEELSFYQAISPDEEKLKKIILKKNEGIAGYVARTREKLIVNDAQSDVRHDKRADKATGKITKNLIAIPIIFKNRLIGIMEVINKITGDFTEEDLKKADLLANIAGVALENARLHEETEENYEMIKKLEASKTEFISLLSHELYTPLTSISGYTDLLLKHYESINKEILKDSLDSIKDRSTHLHMLINDLFIVNEIDELRNNIELKLVDIRSIIKERIEHWSNLNPNNNVTFDIKDDGDEEKFLVNVDANKLSHCLFHLLNNGAKFSDPGSEINVEIERKELEGKDFLQVSVKDSGIGIKEEYKEKIFEKFFQISGGFARSYEGLGIGLFICRRIVEALGGNITCEIEHGKGSTFYVSLPVYNNIGD